jgi:hypothetical protein
MEFEANEHGLDEDDEEVGAMVIGKAEDDHDDDLGKAKDDHGDDVEAVDVGAIMEFEVNENGLDEDEEEVVIGEAEVLDDQGDDLGKAEYDHGDDEEAGNAGAIMVFEANENGLDEDDEDLGNAEDVHGDNEEVVDVGAIMVFANGLDDDDERDTCAKSASLNKLDCISILANSCSYIVGRCRMNSNS